MNKYKLLTINQRINLKKECITLLDIEFNKLVTIIGFKESIDLITKNKNLWIMKNLLFLLII